MATPFRFTWLTLPGLVLACGQVLGIEEAHIDPSLRGVNAGRASGGQAGTAPDNRGGSLQFGGQAGSPPGTGGIEHPHSTGGTDSEGGTAGEGGAGGAQAPVMTTCARYCDAIVQYCTNEYLQYRDREQCMAVCKLLPEGQVEDPDGNTASCRLKYADKARYAAGRELAAYCRQAGPGGDDRCGANCDGFCTIMMATCYDGRTEPYFFKSMQSCLTTCAGLPQIPYSYGDGTLADGNTLQCRLFHATSAVMMDPEEHCAHSMGITLCEASSD